MSEKVDYLIGQRVIANNSGICTVIYSKEKIGSIQWSQNVWVKRANGNECWFDAHNIKPLPNGQL